MNCVSVKELNDKLSTVQYNNLLNLFRLCLPNSIISECPAHPEVRQSIIQNDVGHAMSDVLLSVPVKIRNGGGAIYQFTQNGATESGFILWF